MDTKQFRGIKVSMQVHKQNFCRKTRKMKGFPGILRRLYFRCLNYFFYNASGVESKLIMIEIMMRPGYRIKEGKLTRTKPAPIIPLFVVPCNYL